MADYAVSALAMLEWLRRHNCRVRFHSNKTVEVWLNSARRRRKTLSEAIEAHGGPRLAASEW